jgi:hypothetical protein
VVFLQQQSPWSHIPANTKGLLYLLGTWLSPCPNP